MVRYMSTVPVWSGVEVRALREARRMSVRGFAEHLGVCNRMVSRWENGGADLRPRPINQAALDTSLRTADPDTQARYAQLAAPANAPRPAPRPRVSPTGLRLPNGFRHLVRHPFDGKVMTLIESGPVPIGNDPPRWVIAFYIDIEPVTHGEYARFLAAAGRKDSASLTDLDAGASEAVTGVPWPDANEYVRYVCKMLPTVLEWERAAHSVEGLTTSDVREWCRKDNEQRARRGPTTAPAGGFRCATPATDLLELLSI
jgi:formylglycine-generating enzyme required for sulfatase activity